MTAAGAAAGVGAGVAVVAGVEAEPFSVWAVGRAGTAVGGVETAGEGEGLTAGEATTGTGATVAAGLGLCAGELTA